jgi:hypothetical protein
MSTRKLPRKTVSPGELSMPSYRFNNACCWSEVHGASLLITGGMNRDPSAVRKVVRIETPREFAVTHCPPMLTPRREHAASHSTSLHPWRFQWQMLE